jgi:alpha-D-ribose 1-methylphosphonate 5-triphosphate diphosphatase
MSAFKLHDSGWSLPRALATVTRTPARAIGLHDRGEILPGQRADLARVRRCGARANVMQTWVRGERVA